MIFTLSLSAQKQLRFTGKLSAYGYVLSNSILWTCFVVSRLH